MKNLIKAILVVGILTFLFIVNITPHMYEDTKETSVKLKQYHSKTLATKGNQIHNFSKDIKFSGYL